MSGRTIWLMRDAGWWGRVAVRRARREFGPTGPAVMDWLECEAKKQNHGGRLKAGALAIAEDIGTDEVTVHNVVSHLVTHRWLVEHEDDGDTFKTLIVWFSADQTRGLGAERAAKSRDKQRETDEPVTARNGASRSATNREEKVKERAKALSLANELEKATDEDRASCRLFYELGRQRNPKMKVPQRGSREQTAAVKAMRLLRERDEQPATDIQRLIRWLFTDDCEDAVFWGSTIQAPSGLRSNFSKVWSKMAAAERPALQSARNPRPESTTDRVARFEALKAQEANAA